MESSDAETDFDETSARNVTNIILKDDIKTYKKYLPQIKRLDSDAFKNMFQGNKEYEYNIQNRYHFNLLLDKFNNFSTLLDEWYEEEDKYDYIKQLWLKYISIESMKNKTESEIQNFLSTKNINYSSWPSSIKEKFLQICANTEQTIIYKFKKSFEKLPNTVKKLLGVIYSISKYCSENGKKLFQNFSFNYIFSIIKKYIGIDLDNNSKLKEICISLCKFFKIDDFKMENILEYLKNIIAEFPLMQSSKNIIQVSTNLASVFDSTIGSICYGIIGIYNLTSAFLSYSKIIKSMEKIKGFEKAVDEINKRFQEHKKIVDEKLESNKSRDIENLNSTIEICIEYIKHDKIDIIELIKQIKDCLDECKLMEKEKIAKIIASIIQAGVGVVACILTGGISCILYIGGALLNGATVVLEGININHLKTNIKELERILKKANDLEKEIDEELERIANILKENNDSIPSFCED